MHAKTHFAHHTIGDADPDAGRQRPRREKQRPIPSHTHEHTTNAKQEEDQATSEAKRSGERGDAMHERRDETRRDHSLSVPSRVKTDVSGELRSDTAERYDAQQWMSMSVGEYMNEKKYHICWSLKKVVIVQVWCMYLFSFVSSGEIH
jgi:hypothetical protein